MWTEQAIALLIEKLQHGSKEAVDRNQWDRLDELSAALKLISARVPGANLDALVAQITRLAGEDLVRRAALESGLTEPVAWAAGPGATVEKPSPAADITSPVVGEEKPSKPAAESSGAARRSESASVPPSTGAEPPRQEVPSSPSMAPPPPEIQEKLGPLLHDLIQLSEEQPGDFDAVPDFLGKLQRALGKVDELCQGTSEVAQARARVALLREMVRIRGDLVEIGAAAARAKEYLLLKDATKARDDVNKQLEEFKKDVERYAQVYPQLTAKLQNQFQQLKTAVIETRDSIGSELRIWLTKNLSSRRETLEAQITDLEELHRKLVPDIPTDLVEDKTERTVTQIGDLKLKLLAECTNEAKRLYGEAKDQLERGELATAKERCETGLTFAQSPTILHDPDAEVWSSQLQDLLRNVEERISARDQIRQQARTLADEAMRIADPVQALKMLAQAEALFPGLPGLATNKTTLADSARTILHSAARKALEDAAGLARRRLYAEAIEVLAKAQERLDPLPKDIVIAFGELAVPTYQETHQVSVDSPAALRELLLQREQELRSESIAWLDFQKQLESFARRAPRVRDGMLDEEWLAKEEARFASVDLQRFSGEWRSALDELAKKAGAQASYQAAAQRLDKNPVDAGVTDLVQQALGQADHESQLFKDAKELQRRYEFNVHWNRFNELLASEGLVTNVNKWVADIESAAASVRATVGEREKPLLPQVDALVALAHALRRLKTESDNLEKSKGYAAAWDRLKLVNSSGKTDDPDEPLRTSKGLSWLRSDLGKRWRSHCLKSIDPGVLRSVDGGCRPEPGVTLAKLKEALGYLDELRGVPELTGDGDGTRAECIRYLWRSAELQELIGAPLEGIDDRLIEDLLQQDRVDWRALLDHLAALLAEPGRLPGKVRPSLERLRSLALGLSALYMPRAAAITFLEERRQQDSLRHDPAICALLTLRLLEAPEGEESALVLVKELRDAGWGAQALGDALAQLIDAYTCQRAGDMELAIATLEEGLSALRGLAPELARVLERALANTQATWRRILGEKLLTDALKDEADAEGMKAFEVLRALRRSEELLGDNRRAQAVIARVRAKAKSAFDELHREASRLAGSVPGRLQDGIQEARKLEGYLNEAVGPTAGTPGKGVSRTADSELQQLEGDLKQVHKRLDEWESAQRGLETARRALQRLLEEEHWAWNNDPRRTPLRELREIKVRLTELENKFGADVPPEFRNFQLFVRALEAAVGEVSGPFEIFRTGFEGDTYQNEQDFIDARQALAEVRQKAQEQQRLLRERARETQWVGSPIDLDRFFLIHDYIGRPQLRENTWFEGTDEDLSSPSAAATRLESRYRNWHDWGEWTAQSIQLLETLQDDLANAERSLRGGVRKARQMASEQIPLTLSSIQLKQAGMPAPPMTRLARQAAGNVGAFQPDPDAVAEVLRTWQEIRQASRHGVRKAWHEYLTAELKEVESQRRKLEDACQRKQDQLVSLIREMDAHVRQSRRATSYSQETYEDLLRRAEDLDPEDPQVVGHRQQFESRQRQVTRQ